MKRRMDDIADAMIALYGKPVPIERITDSLGPSGGWSPHNGKFDDGDWVRRLLKTLRKKEAL